MKYYLKQAYDDHDQASDETGLECKDPTLTQQHDEHDANINNIVAKYMKTGMAEFHNRPPIQEDFQTITSMQDALQLMVDAKNAFMEQPAAVRAKFDNDPAKFVEYCSDEANRDGMRAMGLLSDDEMQRHLAAEAGKRRMQEALESDAKAYRTAQAAPKS